MMDRIEFRVKGDSGEFNMMFDMRFECYMGGHQACSKLDLGAFCIRRQLILVLTYNIGKVGIKIDAVSSRSQIHRYLTIFFYGCDSMGQIGFGALSYLAA